MSALDADKLALLVEDDDDHAVLLRRAFKRHAPQCELMRVADGEQALEVLRTEPRCRPALILLDLRLPTMSGLDVLLALKQSRRLRALPVMVWTTSENEADMADAYAHGANAYLVKPSDLIGFDQAVRDLARFWLFWNRAPGALLR